MARTVFRVAWVVLVIAATPVAGEESVRGEGSAGGLVWSVCLERVNLRPLVGQCLDKDLHLLPGERFPLPELQHHWSMTAELGYGISPESAFPVPYLCFEFGGEYISPSRQNRYVGFLPVNADGSLPVNGIDWWSWETAKGVEPEKWVESSFRWEEPSIGATASFSSGRLILQGLSEAATSVDLPFDRGYVASFDSESGRFAIGGFDSAFCEWHISVFSRTGRLLFQDPWDLPPSTHLHPSEDGRSLLYAVWFGGEASVPGVDGTSSDGQRAWDLRALDPDPAVGVYRLSLRTGRVRKVPPLAVPGIPEDRRKALIEACSPDGSYVLRVGDQQHSTRFFDESNLAAPELLWERFEGRSFQHAAVSAGGEYVAEMFYGKHWPEGPEGQSRWDWTSPVLRLRNKQGDELGTRVYSETQGPYTQAMVFSGPYLLVGYDGRGVHAQGVYLHDMRVPWNLGGGVIDLE